MSRRLRPSPFFSEPARSRRDRERARAARLRSSLRDALEALEGRVMLSGATITVNNPTDVSSPAELSLREAIELVDGTLLYANLTTAQQGQISSPTLGLDPVITFDPVLDNQTITLAGTELPRITADVTINGPGSDLLAISGGVVEDYQTVMTRVLDVANGAFAVVSGLTIENGNGEATYSPASESTYSGGLILNAGTLTLSDSVVRDGNVGGLGGGIKNTGTLTLDETTVSNNGANYGGGLFNLGTMTLTDSTVSGNFGYQVGGLYNEGTLTIAGGSFAYNNSSQSAGGLLNAGGATVSGVLFFQNEGGYGGGIMNRASGDLSVTTSRFSYNSGNYGGGAIQSYGVLTISDSTLDDNNADVGGGLDIEGGSAVVTESTLYENSSYQSGETGQGGYGGTALNLGTLRLIDSTITDNTSSSVGPGGVINGGNLFVGNSIISDNSGLDISSEKSVLGVGDPEGTFDDLGHNLIGSNSGDYTLSNTDVVTEMTGLGPFGDNGGPTPTLVPTGDSPALGQGDPSLVAGATDQRGVARVVNGMTDIGAVESATAVDLAVTGTSSPVVAQNGQLAYSLTVTNLSATDQVDVTLDDVLPDHTTLVSWYSPDPGWTLNAPATGSGGTVTAVGDSLAAGTSATFTLIVQLDASYAIGDTVDDTATVGPFNGDRDLDDNIVAFQATVSDPSQVSTSPVTIIVGPGSPAVIDDSGVTLPIVVIIESDPNPVTIDGGQASNTFIQGAGQVANTTLVGGPAGSVNTFIVDPSGNDLITLQDGGGTNTLDITGATLATTGTGKSGSPPAFIGATLDLGINGGQPQEIYQAELENPDIGSLVDPDLVATSSTSSLALVGQFQNVIAGSDSTLYAAPAAVGASTTEPGTRFTLVGTGNTVFGAEGSTVQAYSGGNTVVQKVDPASQGEINAYLGVQVQDYDSDPQAYLTQNATVVAQYIAVNPAAEQAFLTGNATVVAQFLTTNDVGLQAYLVANATGVAQYLANNATAEQAYLTQNATAVAQYIAVNPTAEQAYLTQNATAVAQYIAVNPAAEQAYLAQNATTVEQYIASDPTALQAYLAQNATAVAQFLIASPTAEQAYVRAEVAGVGAYIIANPTALAAFLKANPDAGQVYLQKGATVLQQYITANPTLLQQYLATNATLLQQYLAGNPTTLQQYLSGNPTVLEQYLSVNVTALQQYLSVNPGVLQAYLTTDLAALQQYLTTNPAVLQAYLLSGNAALLQQYIAANPVSIQQYLSGNPAVLQQFLTANATALQQYLVGIPTLLQQYIGNPTLFNQNLPNVDLQQFLASNPGLLQQFLAANPTVLQDFLTNADPTMLQQDLTGSLLNLFRLNVDLPGAGNEASGGLLSTFQIGGGLFTESVDNDQFQALSPLIGTDGTTADEFALNVTTAGGNNTLVGGFLSQFQAIGGGKNQFVIEDPSLLGLAPQTPAPEPSTFTGSGPNDTFYFVGGGGGNDFGHVVLKETDSAPGDTLDFSNFQGGGISVNLNVSGEQAVSPGNLYLTLPAGGVVTNVVGSPAADTIIGNGPNDVLQGSAAPVTDPNEAPAIPPSNVPVQYALLDFTTYTPTTIPGEPNEDLRTYSADDQAAVLNGLQTDYALFPDVHFVTSTAAIPANTPYLTVFFNDTPIINGEPTPGGFSNEVDFGNLNRSTTVQVDVNGFLAPDTDQAPDSDAGLVPDTDSNFVNLSTTVAAHEVGHTLGLEHMDSFGPVDFGISAPPGLSAYLPAYAGPLGAFTTQNDIMASPASVGSTLADAASGDSQFGERDAISLAFVTDGTTIGTFNDPLPHPSDLPAPTGPTLKPTTLKILRNGVATNVNAQPVSAKGGLYALSVPNPITSGFNAGKNFQVSAVNIDGFIGGTQPVLGANHRTVKDAKGNVYTTSVPNDYSFKGQAGQVVSLQAMSASITSIPDPVDTVLTVYGPGGQVVATNDDQFEPSDSSIYDLTLPTTGAYVVEVGAFHTTDVSFDTAGSQNYNPAAFYNAEHGEYELFIYSASASNATSGTDTISIAPPATHLAFLSVPATGTVGTALGGVMVAVEDAYGDIVTGDTSTITVSVASGPGDSFPTPVMASAVGGIATFNNLVLGANGAYTLSATDGSLTSGRSGTIDVGLDRNIDVLDPSAPGALSLSHGAELDVPGLIDVNSGSTTALTINDNSGVEAGSIRVAGGSRVSQAASLSPLPITGASAVADPLAGLAAPAAGNVPSGGAVVLSGNSTLMINPGLYSGISVSGSARLTLEPGVYLIAGGGVRVSGNASLTGSQVMIYNEGLSPSGTGKALSGVILNGSGAINLSPPSTGAYTGILIFQARDNRQPLNFNATGPFDLNDGVIYAPSAPLVVSTPGPFSTPAVVDTLQITGAPPTGPGNPAVRTAVSVPSPGAVDPAVEGLFAIAPDDAVLADVAANQLWDAPARRGWK